MQITDSTVRSWKLLFVPDISSGLSWRSHTESITGSATHSVQENFNLIISFIQDSADKHIPSKTSRSVSSVSWITPTIRRKIRRKNATHAKAKKSGSAKIRTKFETLRRESKLISGSNMIFM